MIIRNSNLRERIFSNRYKILAVIIAIILILSLIQFLNYWSQLQIQNENANKQENTTNNSLVSQEAIIQGGSILDTQGEVNTKQIDTFIQYCNEAKVQEAYQLLSDECKEQMYPSIEQFKKNFWSVNFKVKKDYKIENWINTYDYYTYKIKMYEDIMTTGKVKDTYIEDYFTIDRKTQKLNINNYIGRELINTQQEIGEIKIDILYRDIYLDYESYEMRITNKTDKTILLDTKDKTKTMYIEGDNDVTYSAYSHELNESNLKILSQYSKKLTIKYNKVYKANNKTRAIYFSDFIVDYEEYVKFVDKSLYTNRAKIRLDL